ncbi:MAG: hotdog fold thioesterase [Lentimicrobiaceae bacterium]
MDVKEFLMKDRFAEMLGIQLLEAGNGKAKAKMELHDEHMNAVDIAQGGAIFSLADLTLAAAANSQGKVAVAVNVNISFVKAAGKGTLFAEAFETSQSIKLATYTINITNSEGDLVACAQGMVYRKEKTF